MSLGALATSAVATDRLYRRYLRDWVLTWGATDEEVARRLPGDELLESADIVAKIPLTGRTGSLNAASAAAIGLFEVRRVRTEQIS